MVIVREGAAGCKGMAADGTKSIAYINRHSRRPLTVIPAQAGIQEALTGNRLVFVTAVLDSRLRGNDGSKAAGMTFAGGGAGWAAVTQ